ncbi:MAG: hypothetical protein ACP5UV_06400 [Thermoplasmata archaeon]
MSIAMIGTGPLGGTCVNVGCVPSKYLLEASHRVFMPDHPRMKGIYETAVKYDFSEVMNSPCLCGKGKRIEIRGHDQQLQKRHNIRRTLKIY